MKKIAKKYYVIEWAYIPLHKSVNPLRDVIKAESEDAIHFDYFRVIAVYNSFAEVPENIYSI